MQRRLDALLTKFKEKMGAPATEGEEEEQQQVEAEEEESQEEEESHESGEEPEEEEEEKPPRSQNDWVHVALKKAGWRGPEAEVADEVRRILKEAVLVVKQ
jgi:hypothetical protein